MEGGRWKVEGPYENVLSLYNANNRGKFAGAVFGRPPGIYENFHTCLCSWFIALYYLFDNSRRIVLGRVNQGRHPVGFQVLHRLQDAKQILITASLQP